MGCYDDGVVVVRSQNGQQDLLLVDRLGQVAPVMTSPPSLVTVAVASSDDGEIVVVGYLLEDDTVDFGDRCATGLASRFPPCQLS